MWLCSKCSTQNRDDDYICINCAHQRYSYLECVKLLKEKDEEIKLLKEALSNKQSEIEITSKENLLLSGYLRDDANKLMIPEDIISNICITFYIQKID